MIEQGIISKIDGNNIEVIMRKEVACCGQSCDGTSCNVETYTFKAENKNALDLKIGQKVEVKIPAASTFRGLLLVFVIPFGVFSLLYGFSPRILESLPSSSRMAISMVGLIGSWFAGKWIAPKESRTPIVTQSIQE